MSVNGRLTFTMTATGRFIAELDGIQYLDGGPCEDTVRTGVRHTYTRGDAADEERWQLFARATAAAGVRSTLSLPILEAGRVVAGINMYASTVSAFDGHHEELAVTFGAWAAGAVENADMAFATRFQAAKTPGRLRAQNLVDQAVGALMAQWTISADEAEDRVRTSAHRAGISELQMARAIVSLLAHASDVPEDDA